ncbi:hypothetical protein [Acinetobacter pittii]|uniref:hypothetical protein n=1 Tax=Acinetobacter pittii TaxID=48296 RepID=UPI0032608844
MIYAIAILLLGILIVLIAIYQNSSKENDHRKEFTDFDDLISFIKKKYKCEVEHEVPLYGFVKEDASIQKQGYDPANPAIDVSVLLITSPKPTIVDAPCGDLQADLKKGDFVAVMPFYNTRHRFWYYITIAKLKPIYLGNKKGFLIDENFIKKPN